MPDVSLLVGELLSKHHYAAATIHDLVRLSYASTIHTCNTAATAATAARAAADDECHRALLKN